MNGLGLRRQAPRGGLGRMGGFALGPSGSCVCPRCGYKEPHTTGLPCYMRRCPRCGARCIALLSVT